MYLGGLSQAPAGVPVDITANLTRLKAMIDDGLAKAAAAGRADLHKAGKDFQSTLNAIRLIDVQGGLWDSARREIISLLFKVVAWLKEVNLLVIGGAVAERKAEAGASAWSQALVAVGLKPEESLYVPKLSSDIELPAWLGGLPWWVLPAGAGLVLFLLLRR